MYFSAACLLAGCVIFAGALRAHHTVFDGYGYLPLLSCQSSLMSAVRLDVSMADRLEEMLDDKFNVTHPRSFEFSSQRWRNPILENKASFALAVDIRTMLWRRVSGAGAIHLLLNSGSWNSSQKRSNTALLKNNSSATLMPPLSGENGSCGFPS